MNAHAAKKRAGARLSLSCLLIAGLMLVLGAFAQSSGDEGAQPLVHVLAVDGPIGPATRDYVVRGIESAESEDVELLVLRLDTPGGLDASMRDMIKTMLNSSVPVATWVGPSGARAASAGTYMLYASHVAAMAPSTNLGAATPVQIGGGGGQDEAGTSPTEQAREALGDGNEGDPGEGAAAGDSQSDAGERSDSDDSGSVDDESNDGAPTGDPMARKAVEDAVAYIRGLAERHGRNADWAERAVRESVSLTAADAADMNVIDLVSNDIPALLEAIDGREVRMAAGSVVLDTRNAELVEKEPDWRNRFLSVVSNPTLAYILLMVGIYGLILEGYSPGALVPGVIGGICLLLALYAFQILPVNYAGLALMLLGFALVAVEVFVPSFGILGIGGIVAVVFGSIILFDSEVPGMGINTGVIAAMGLASALVFVVIVYLAAKSFRQPRAIGRETLAGRRAEAISDFSGGRGRVHLEGEDWSAACEQPIRRGQAVEIVEVNGLVLQVRPVDPSSQGATP